MYGKMQETGIIEDISSICISIIWGHHPAFFITHIPYLAPEQPPKVVVPPLGSQALFPFWETSFTFGGLKSLRAVTSLFIDMAGDILFHNANIMNEN